jgi:hypothetical protein
MTFVLDVHGGLANRLQSMLSHWATHHELVVHWRPDSQICFAKWEDVFEPIPNIQFVYEWPEDATTMVRSNHPDPNAPADWLNAYRLVMLKEAHLARMLATVTKRPYAAIHVRRTDFIPLARATGCYESEDKFLTWCKNAIIGDGPVFVATDNGTTQKQFIAAIREMGREAIVSSEIAEHSAQDLHDHRNTSLADAAIDLFVCARADQFLGTDGSSFSAHASMLHRLTGWWT